MAPGGNEFDAPAMVLQSSPVPYAMPTALWSGNEAVVAYFILVFAINSNAAVTTLLSLSESPSLNG